MSTEPEIAVTHEPRKLGLVGKAIVGLMVAGTVAFSVWTALVLRAKAIEHAKIQEERRQLEFTMRATDENVANGKGPMPLEDGKIDPTGRSAILTHPKGFVDVWGHPVYYRCPGPVHKNGWDLISCGPNGVFENGAGDDIVVGEDLPGGIAAISSESGTATVSK